MCFGSFAQSNVKQSAYFDGTTNYIDAPAQAPFVDNSNRKITFEVWEKQDAFSLINQTLMYMNTTIAVVNPLLDIHIKADTIYGTYGNGSYVSCPLTFDTNWHHIALVCDTSSTGADSLNLYVDGTYMNNTVRPHTYTICDASQSFSIGSATTINLFKGHIANVVITSGVLYTASFAPDCMYDTSHINYTTNKCVFPTLLVAPLNSGTYMYNHIFDTGASFISVGVGSGIAPTYTNGSPCMPVYTYSVDTTTYIDSMVFFAHNINPSFDKGSYVYHISNGFTGSSISPIQGTFTDTLIVGSIDTIVIYTDDNGDTTGHAARKTLTSHLGVTVYNNVHISLYPNPSTGTIYISEPAKISVYDMSGKCIINEYVKSFNLSTGIYICLINDKSYKIVVQ